MAKKAKLMRAYRLPEKTVHEIAPENTDIPTQPIAALNVPAASVWAIATTGSPQFYGRLYGVMVRNIGAELAAQT